jgi:hypothetical protein
MKHVVTTNTIDPPTKNETVPLYGTNLKQNYFYFNCQCYIKYEVLSMGARHSYILWIFLQFTEHNYIIYFPLKYHFDDLFITMLYQMSVCRCVNSIMYPESHMSLLNWNTTINSVFLIPTSRKIIIPHRHLYTGNSLHIAARSQTTLAIQLNTNRWVLVT